MSADGHLRVLIVDDDPIAAESLAEHLSETGFETATAFDGEEALEALSSAEQSGDRFSIAICDVAMPHMNGLELLREMRKHHPSVVAIMVTGYGTIESAVESIRLGATDFLTKPIIGSELKFALERAGQQHALLAENQTLREQLEERRGLDSVVGVDHRMRKIFELVEAVAPSKTTVLMTGESGVGKSLIARAIHQSSPRRDRAYVELACGSIPETLLESELFGHVKGAFTGAHADKIGRFLAADGGTIFLDEINSASPGMQLKLLRVLQERKFEPVGSTRTIEVDVRVVLAANQPLEELVAAGTFRQDLYYRINVVNIELPPLRDRLADVKLLADHFLEAQSLELGKQLTGFTGAAAEALLRYSYPGNVRELQNIIERAAVLTRSPTIDVCDLPEHVVQNSTRHMVRSLTGSDDVTADEWVPMPLEEALREPERRIIMRALEANDWNRQRTAEQLRINRTTLYKKMKALGIGPATDRKAG